MQHTLMYITDSKIRRNKIVYIKYNHVMPSMDQVNQFLTVVLLQFVLKWFV